MVVDFFGILGNWLVAAWRLRGQWSGLLLENRGRRNGLTVGALYVKIETHPKMGWNRRVGRLATGVVGLPVGVARLDVGVDS